MKYVLLCLNMLLLSYLTGVPVKFFSPTNIDTSRAVVLKLGGRGSEPPGDMYPCLQTVLVEGTNTEGRDLVSVPALSLSPAL